MKISSKKKLFILFILLLISLIFLFVVKSEKDVLQKNIDLVYTNAVTDSMNGLNQNYVQMDSEQKIQCYYQTLSNLHDALDVFYSTSYKKNDNLFRALSKLYNYLIDNRNESNEIEYKSDIFDFLRKILVYPNDSQLITDFQRFLDSLSGVVTTIVPTSTPTKMPVTITPTPIPLNNKSISEVLGLTKEWNPNHGIISIAYEEVGDYYGDCNEYVFISQTEGWKAYIGPIGAGQDFIVLYKTTDSGMHWKKIYEPPMGGGDILFLNSKIGWIVHNWPVNGSVELTKTLDGGVTWEDERINVPADYSNVVFETGLPVFFSQDDGIMFASCYDVSQNSSNLDSVTFITHDGGESWSLNAKNDVDKIFTWSLTFKDGIFSDFNIIYNNVAWRSNNNREWVNVSD